MGGDEVDVLLTLFPPASLVPAPPSLAPVPSFVPLRLGGNLSLCTRWIDAPSFTVFTGGVPRGVEAEEERALGCLNASSLVESRLVMIMSSSPLPLCVFPIHHETKQSFVVHIGRRKERCLSIIMTNASPLHPPSHPSLHPAYFPSTTKRSKSTFVVHKRENAYIIMRLITNTNTRLTYLLPFFTTYAPSHYLPQHSPHHRDHAYLRSFLVRLLLPKFFYTNVIIFFVL